MDTGYSSAQVDVPKREPEVAKATRNIQANIEQAEKALAELTERLSPILSVVPPAASGMPGKPIRNALPPLAGMLVDSSDRIEALVAKVSALSQRIEL